MSAAEKGRRLGRGLEALLAARGNAAAPKEDGAAANAPAQETASGVLRQVAIVDIRANPYQPRKEFRTEELEELRSSIAAAGLLQPITVRPAPNGARGYELIAGERRLRSVTALGWTEVPAVVRDIDDRTLLTLALVENLQRADLNPIEEAEGYQRLIDDFGLTQQQVAEVVGKDRSTVANMLRVLQLPAAVRRMLQEGALTLGHARALLGMQGEHGMVDLAREITERGMSVRDVERRVRERGGARKGTRPREDAGATGQAPEARLIEDQLWRRLQTDVKLVLGDKERGEIRIAFYSGDDLARLLDMIVGEDRDTIE